MMPMQDQIVAGETLNYRAVAAKHPASAGWVVTLYLNPRAGGTATNVVGTAEGDDHLLQVPAATTAGWAAGWWAWEAWAALGAERYRLEAGQLQVVAGLIGAAAGTDTRTQAQRALDDHLAVRAQWNPTVQSYRIGGREMTFASKSELDAEIAFWEKRVKQERVDEILASGRPNPRKLQVMLGRA